MISDAEKEHTYEKLSDVFATYCAAAEAFLNEPITSVLIRKCGNAWHVVYNEYEAHVPAVHHHAPNGRNQEDV